MKSLRNKLIIGVIFGALVMVGLGIYADFTEMARLLRAFRWGLLPAAIGLTVVNYLLRFTKWHFYLRQIGVKNLSWWADLRVFLGGFGFSLTPGKAGELVRLLWLKNLADVHPARTAPVALAERLTDGIAMAILALIGGLIYPQFTAAALTIGMVLVVAVVVIQIRPLALWALGIGERLPLVNRIAHHLHDLYESAYALLRLKNLLIAVTLGAVAWVSEGVALYLVLLGLGMPAGGQLALLSIFILAFASVAGGASGVPGGLGVTEGGLTGMLQLLAGASENVAATATLLIRFATMWFGVVLGLLIQAIWRDFLYGDSNAADLASISAAMESPPEK